MRKPKSKRGKITNVILCFPFLLLILIYQKFISILLPSSCIYWPSCSEYSKQVLKKHGLLPGLYLSLRRLARCHPFARGGVDEAPDSFSF